ncbi:ABC transporter substrate-binding protein [Nesterenkonia ebinurensis]|uniref:ABC transporter substrate-binding protein n=1 Tax=Nesterenkonia ebinurensis TaxID=2608252 RepID=UPI00123D3436|nr:extracellular solute-binding protein [Nesterenkonia ebinurensis]
MKRTSACVKRRAALSGILVSALALTACGDNGGGSADGFDEDQEITLEVAWWGNDERVRLTQEVFDVFEERHENITVRVTPTGEPDALFDRLSTDFAAGGGPDLFTLGGAMPQEYGQAGALLDLEEVSDYLDLEPYDDFTVQNATIGDTIHGLPTGGNAIGALLNATLFEEARVDIPDEDWDWPELVEITVEISENTDDGVYGLDLRVQDVLGMYAGQLTEPGLGIYDWDGGLAIDEEVLTTWYEMEVELVERGGLPDPSIIVEHHNVTPDQTLFAVRDAAITFGYTNQLTPYTAALGDDEVLMMMPPTDTDLPGVSWQPSQFWAINSNTDHPEATAMLMDFILNDPEAADILQDDRGLPANPEMLEVVEPLLDPVNAEAATYLLDVLEVSVIGPPQPAGGAEMNDLTQRMETDILFGERSVDEAAEYWIEYMENALGQ